MKKYLYPIVISKIRPYLKLWFLKGGEYLSAIMQSLPLTLNNTLWATLRNIKIYGNTVQDGEPTPENPVEIINVEGKNLFNKNLEASLSLGATKSSLDTGVRITSTADGTYKYCGIELGKDELLGKTLTLSLKITPNASNDGICILYYGNSSNIVSVVGISRTSSGKATGTIASSFPNNCDRIYILFYSNRNGTGVTDDYVDYTNVQIEEGSVATPYVPYNSIGVKVQNKNLLKLISKDNFSWNGLTITSVDRSSYKLNQTATGTNSLIIMENLVLEAGTYTISQTNLIYNDNNNRVVVIDESTSNAIANTQGVTSTTFTIAEEKTVKVQIVILSGSIFNNTIVNFQLKKSTTASSYIAHAEQNKYFTFEEGQYLAEGDYLADDGIHKIWGEVVLDGSEDEVFGVSTALNTTDYNCFYCINGSFAQAPNDTTICVYCDKLIGESSNHRTVNKMNCWLSHFNNSNLFMHVPNTITTVEELKTWLSNNNLIFQFILREPTVIPYTQTQQEEWNEIKKLHSYNEQTNIDVLANLSAKISLDYMVKGGEN